MRPDRGCAEVAARGCQCFWRDGHRWNGRVVSFEKSLRRAQPIPGSHRRHCKHGIYVFNAQFLYEQLDRDADDPRSSHDFGKDVIPYIVARYACLRIVLPTVALASPRGGEPYWRDVGTIDAYWEANMELTKVVPELNLYEQQLADLDYRNRCHRAKFVFDDNDRRG